MVKRTLILIIALALFIGTSSSFGAYEWVLLDGELKIPRHALTGEAINGYVYAIGGIVSGGTAPTDSQNAVSMYNPATDNWTLVDSMPTARHSLSSAVIDGWIYAVCGHVVNSRSENQRYNGTSWESRASVYARSGPGVDEYNGELYVFGGNHYSTILSRFDIYNPTTNTWRIGGDMPSATEPWRATTLGNKIYVNVGGENKKIWCYNPIANTWDTSITEMNVSRSGYELQAVNGRIYAIGGSNSSGAIASVESWAPGETVWRIEPSLNIARSGFGSAVIGNDIYIFGGHNGGDLGSTEVLTLSEPPVASFTYLPEYPMVGGRIEFDASNSEGEIVKYEWDFGDEQSHISGNHQAQHVFQSSGIYTVKLTVTDVDNLTDSVSVDLHLDNLKKGDLLLCRTLSSYVPANEWTHIGMYIGNNEIVEAVEEGVVVHSITEDPIADPEDKLRWDFPYKTWVSVVRVNTDDETREKAVDFAIKQKNEKFDFWSILPPFSKQSEGDRWYCSELVWAAYLNASEGKIDLDNSTGLVSPDEISSSSYVEVIGEHKEERPPTIYELLRAFVVVALSPVDIVITDPDGLILNKQGSEIPGAIYKEVEVDEDSDVDDLLAIPEPKSGIYLIQVVAEPGTLPTDTFNIVISRNGTTRVLVQDVQLQDIPDFPFVVTTLDSLSADMEIDPETLNLSSKGNWITCYIHFPEAYYIDNIDSGTILLNGEIPPARLFAGDEEDIEKILMIKFPRSDLQKIIEPGNVELIVTGELFDGTPFECTDTIRVIDKGKNKESKGKNKK